MASKRSAKVVCRGDNFWVTPKIFWRWVREGTVEFQGEYPLTGKFAGGSQEFLITVRHSIMDISCPEHLQAYKDSLKYCKR